MPRMIEISTGKTLTITGPGRVVVYGQPALSGTQPVPAEDQSNGKSTPEPAKTTP